MSTDKTVFQPRPKGSLHQGVRLNGMFEIEELIAEGGMGEVYRGLAVASGDAVAIKVVRPEMSRDPDVMALFRREASILHDLLHDAIVRYYVFSLEPELQRYYIAMEFVDGVSLQKRLVDGPLTPTDARILLKRIGGALEQAHSRGVIHRDISSDNIILPGGDVRKAKIVDFGIARAAARAAEGTIIGGGFAGKYKYVSPEQLGLYGGEVTPKSDIYSFGLVIAEALRGQPLDMGGSQLDVIEKRRKVPDLTGIEMSLRPLLTAMLAPNPADRPENMAEIASWGDGLTMLRPAVEPPPVATKKRGSAGLVVAVVIGVALGGVGAAIYVFRDSLGFGGGPASVATTETPTPVVPKLPPPAPPAPPTPPPGTSQSEIVPTSPPTPNPTKTVPTVADIVDQMAPKPSQTEVTLAPAKIGDAYRAELPGFGDPTGHGLSLHATPSPPADLAFKDLGGGRSEIAGQPAGAGSFTFDVVATTHAGRNAHMKVTLNVAAKSATAQSTPTQAPKPQPPQPPQAVLDLEAATAGTAFSAGLPPFRSPQPLTLRAGPGLPDGLTLNDLGNGLSQLAGEPRTPGRYEFDVIAVAPGGAEGRMKVRIQVAPAALAPATPVATQEPPPVVTPIAPSTPAVDSIVAFLRDYAAEPCFAMRRDDDPSGRTVTAIGADPAAFVRFGAAFQKAVRSRPDLHALVVQPSQCPAVDFLNAMSASTQGLPRIALDNPEVGKNRPLSGTVSGLNGRPVLLMVVDDDGAVIRLRTQPGQSADTATFSANFTGDPSSFGKPEMVIAVASDEPIGAGEKMAGAPSADLMPKLAAEGRTAQAGAAVALFKFN